MYDIPYAKNKLPNVIISPKLQNAVVNNMSSNVLPAASPIREVTKQLIAQIIISALNDSIENFKSGL